METEVPHRCGYWTPSLGRSEFGALGRVTGDPREGGIYQCLPLEQPCKRDGRGGGFARVGRRKLRIEGLPTRGPAGHHGRLFNSGRGMRRGGAPSFRSFVLPLGLHEPLWPHSCHSSSPGHNLRLTESSCLKGADSRGFVFVQFFVAALFIQLAGQFSRLHFHIFDSRRKSTCVCRLESEPESWHYELGTWELMVQPWGEFIEMWGQSSKQEARSNPTFFLWDDSGWNEMWGLLNR